MSSTPSQPRPGAGVLLDPSMTHLNDLSRASSRASSEASLQRVKNLPGYTTPVFKGKEEQRSKVQADVALKVTQNLYVLEFNADYHCVFTGIHPSRFNRE